MKDRGKVDKDTINASLIRLPVVVYAIFATIQKGRSFH